MANPLADKKLRYLIGADNPELALMPTRIQQIQQRINRIEPAFKLDEDGVLGPKTIDAILNVLMAIDK